jgi:4-carboxymuconolactone decarboxylase
MEDIHSIYTQFKKDFPKIHDLHSALGKEIHEGSGPLDAKTRWLVKLAISAACDHKRALKTHIKKAKDVGLTDAEIKHALLLIIPSSGFPAFMKAYSVLSGMK